MEDNGKGKVISADRVVLAVGTRSNREQLEALETGKVKVHAIGRTVVARRIAQTI